MLVDDFKKLRVYRAAFDVAMDLYARSKAWPSEERYALTDQVRRSSRSVCANIAEAWHKRSYPKHFAAKLRDASSEAAETLVWIDFAEACELLDTDEADILTERVRSVLAGLTKMVAQADRWCGPSTLCEPEKAYDLEA